MSSFSRFFMAASSLLLLAACTPETVQMSSDDFQKPENAAALQNVLSSCKLVMSSDARAANCRAASIAKFALDSKEIATIRRQQIQAYSDGGVSTVPQTTSGTTISASRGTLVR